MTFSADPHLGMVADRFSGSAVVFLATATFTTQTASLQQSWPGRPGRSIDFRF